MLTRALLGEGWVGQGTRTDLHAFRDAVKRGAPDTELFDDHLPCVAKYPRLETRVRASCLKEQSREFRTVTTTVLWGPGGTGKTKKALYDDDGKRKDVYVVPKTDNLKWWNDYAGEDTILINDFYGGCKFGRFLDLLDGHSLQLEIKGGHTYACYTKVYITSNVHPDDWYVDHSTADAEMARRLTEIIELK